MSAVAASASASAAPPEAASSSSSAIVAPAAPVRPAYFERQSLSRCALHALNNLLQSAAFSVADLNAICEQLTPGKGFRNPHKSMIGLGNWDVNVIMRALQTKDLQVSWFDRRKDLTLSNISADSAFGFIVNLPSASFAAFGAQHWISLRRFADGRWWLFDSSNKEAKPVDDLVSCLTGLMPKDSARCQLLIIRQDQKQPQPSQQPGQAAPN